VSRWGHAKEAPGADPDYKEGSTGRWGLMQWTPLSPNSASCERVFSLVKQMFGEQQMSALADYRTTL